MSAPSLPRLVLFLLALCLAGWSACHVFPFVAQPLAQADQDSSAPPAETLERRFATRVQPFLQRYCFSCHGAKKPKASLDLSRDASLTAIANNVPQWEHVLERLEAGEMPPERAPRRPEPRERAAVVAWLRELRDREAERYAGDPGTVLARRLSNAEFDYTIRDLTGVDMRPAREFPVDPANEAGFDNSGESLAMSPVLLKKYLAAARRVSDHVVFTPDGFVFAPHPVVTDTDRDKYCVSRIIAFYDRHKVDLADYFLAAWKCRQSAQVGRSEEELSRLALKAGLSAKYLARIWSILNESNAEVGPLAIVRRLWRDLPGAGQVETARLGCEHLRDIVDRLRGQLKPQVAPLRVTGISPGSQPFVLWRNRQLASRHRSYTGKVFPDLQRLAGQLQDKDAKLAKLLAIEGADATTEQHLRAALERFCAVFPDGFVVADRGPYYNPKEVGKGRPLTAGFHLMQGYFRDDGPLCALILDDRQRRELDALWQELDSVTGAPLRQYRDFIFFERAEPPWFMFEAEFDFARSEDKDATSAGKIARLAVAYLAKARKKGASPEAEEAIQTYFAEMSTQIRSVERARLAAEPRHLQALLTFAERAYRRPLARAEQDELQSFYRNLRGKDDPGHEEALRDTLVTVLLSPDFCYRYVVPEPGAGVRPLSDYALASRLSYFLWSSMPDAELLAHAAAGDLHRPAVLVAQARRMLRDPRLRRLATEFAGNWLDFRRFEEHNSVDRQRFPSFTNELRQAMYEEPIRYFVDIATHKRSVLDLLYGKDTFVNRPLAKHYGMPAPSPGSEEWVHIEDASRYGRGGLLPMAVFLTKNAPGLRTSPVKRGYWVVRRLLGERIPPPPPTVPQLPTDEANLGELTLPQVLARHRADKSCAGCHSRFDAIGLVFEGFGPIGERRVTDLGGRPVHAGATFPDGRDREGLQGLRQYLQEKRQGDFVDNLCRKLFVYALGRNLLPSDRKTLDTMRTRLAAEGYAFGSLVEVIVTSPQFLNQRGREDASRQ